MNNENMAIIEAMLFLAGDEGLDLAVIKKNVNLDANTVKQIIIKLNAKYEVNHHGITILNYDKSKYRLTTLPKYYDFLSSIKTTKKAKLSAANMEVLSIVAYKGPISRMEIEKIRGINSDYMIKKLSDLDLIKIAGRNNEIAGKPFLFKVSDKFMKEFNLNSLNDLPKLELDLEFKEKDIFD